MRTLSSLVRRNVKLYFKDKGMFISSLITPLILLVLYSTFLKNIYEDSFRSALKSAGATIADSIINGCVGGQLVSSLLAVSCVTVSFCSNLLMIRDKVSGARTDLTVAPVSRSLIALGYYISTIFSSLIICFVALGACFLYLAACGWYLTASDVALIVLDIVLLVLFGTALSSCINFPLSTDGQASAVGTVVSSGYGFICGAYMPISNFGEGLRNVLSFLPGTYGTCLIHNHFMRGVISEMSAAGFPDEVTDMIRKGVDCDIEFFGKTVGIGTMYLIMVVSIALLVGIYVLINKVASKNK